MFFAKQLRSFLLKFGFFGKCIISLAALPLILTLFATIAHSAEVSLQWDPNIEPELAGYKLYYRLEHENYTSSASVDVGNQTSFTLPDLEYDTLYYFAVTAYSIDGGESDYSSEISYSVPSPASAGGGGDQYVDIEIPSVSIAAPEYGATVSGVSNIDVVASDDTGVVKVELYVDGVLYATDSSEPFSFSFDTSGLSDGAYELFAKAYDAADNVGQSETILIYVDNSLENQTAPMVVNCYPSSGDPGAQLTVTVTGSNFQDGANVDFGEWIVVQKATFVNERRLDVRIKIHPSKATTGYGSITVINPDGQSGTDDEGFWVN